MFSTSAESPITIGDRSSWHAVYTRYQHEKTVARALGTKGFETLLPVYHERRQKRDRVKVLSLPLFACYVFVKDVLERRLDILTTPGIHFIVSCAGRPASIPVHEIEALRQSIGAGARLEPHRFLKSGECVRVKSGPLAGIHGILVRNKSSYRLVLSVEMLGKAAAVEVDAAQVERLDDKWSCRAGTTYASTVLSTQRQLS